MRRITAVFVLTSICLGCLGQVAVASSASGREVELRDAPPITAWERVGRQALLQVNWDWRVGLGDWSIEFGPGRPGYRALAERKLRRITVWVRAADTPELVAGTIMHEIAHAFDWRYLTPSLRSEWLVARGLPPDTPWYFPVGPLASDYLSGAGDFAESVSWTLQGPQVGFRSCLGLNLSDAERRRIARGCHGLPPDEAQQALIRRWLAELPREASGK